MIPPYGRIGGKRKTAGKIVAMFPPLIHTYIEPFFGAGSVFFKIPKGTFSREILNDIDPAMYSLMKGFQTYEGLDIHQAIGGEYSKEDFYRIKESSPNSAWEQFQKDLVLSKISFLNLRHRYDPIHNKIKTKYDNRYKDRLEGAILYNEDYKTIITKYDSPDSFFYFDPPYEIATHQKRKDTMYEYRAFNIESFLNELSQLQGKFLLTFNMNKSVQDQAIKLGFNVSLMDVPYVSSFRKKRVNELIIKNY